MSQVKVTVASALSGRMITFVDIDNDFDCAICLQVADNPVRCSLSCGSVFCNGCMTQALANKTCPTCPTCNNSNITACRDTVLRNQILKHQVYCPNKGADDAQRKRKASSDERCTWIGRYDELGAHLNVCECEAVPCTNDGCQEKIERRELEAHELACVHRKVECDHCNVIVKAAAMNNHLAQCPEMKISCECDFECSRKLLKERRDKDCSMTEIECKVVGCGAKIKRKDYEEHQAESAQHHVRLLSAEVQKQSADFQRQSTEFQEQSADFQRKQLAEVQKQLAELQKQSVEYQTKQSAEVQRLIKPIPVKWRVTDIAAKVSESAVDMKRYESPMFDVHFHGNHKLYILAEIQGNKVGLYLYKDVAMSDEKSRLNIGGTSFTVTKAGLPDVKRTLDLGQYLVPPNWDGWGWSSFLNGVTPYIDNDGINVTLDIKLSKDDKPIYL